MIPVKEWALGYWVNKNSLLNLQNKYKQWASEPAYLISWPVTSRYLVYNWPTQLLSPAPLITSPHPRIGPADLITWPADLITWPGDLIILPNHLTWWPCGRMRAAWWLTWGSWPTSPSYVTSRLWWDPTRYLCTVHNAHYTVYSEPVFSVQTWKFQTEEKRPCDL